MQIIDGKKIRDKILAKIKKEVTSLSFKPIFCDVLVGDDRVSMQYVRMKKQNAEKIGILFHNANFSASIKTQDLIEEIKILNKIPNMCGIIVQLPLPKTLDYKAVMDAIDPRLDVDCLGTVAGDKFYKGEVNFGFPTALACMTLLNSLNLNSNPLTSLRTRKIVVLGQGELVGKPVTALLKFRGLNPTIITRKTPARDAYGISVTDGENKKEIIKQADVIISGIGKGKYITGDMIKKGAIIIDAGTSESGESSSNTRTNVVGDVDFESVKDMASFLSPVPGGVGPVTIAMLFNNVLKVAKSLGTARGNFAESNI